MNGGKGKERKESLYVYEGGERKKKMRERLKKKSACVRGWWVVMYKFMWDLRRHFEKK